MPYIAPDGTVGGRKPVTRKITDFIQGIFDFIALFFSAITNPPQRIESSATYGNRNGNAYRSGGSGGRPSGRGSGGRNVRGMKNLQGGAEARMGG